MGKRRRWILRRSTAAFFREARRTPGVSFLDWIHGYVYSRWPYFYIGHATGERSLPRPMQALLRGVSRLVLPSADGKDPQQARRAFADGYHGKVVRTSTAEKLVTLDRPIHIEDLEQIIPYESARALLLEDPDHIVALECPCRAERENPCLPLDVCLIVGEPFAGFIADHHPMRSRRITQEEASEILRAEHERGHVHHAFFKDAMLGRFYAICNCCSCCCGAIQAWRTGTPMLASSGYIARADAVRCAGCGACVAACPFDALRLEGGRVSVSRGDCMGCGVCVTACGLSVLDLERDPMRGKPLIDALHC